MARTRTHGILVNRFDQIVDATIEDFCKIFRFKRKLFPLYPRGAKLVIGEIVYDKEDFIERKLYINNDTYSFRFNKKREMKTYSDEDEYNWRVKLIEIYGNNKVSK